MLVDPKMIPPEVVEAAARAAYETPIPGASSWGEKPWEEVDGMLREYFVWQASAAIAAALKVWPGVKPHKVLTVRDNGEGYDLKQIGIILPLPQEKSDD